MLLAKFYSAFTDFTELLLRFASVLSKDIRIWPLAYNLLCQNTKWHYEYLLANNQNAEARIGLHYSICSFKRRS